MDELATFREFSMRHIRPDPERNVQCMLLWTEWVRFYLKKTRDFPKLIGERKFVDLLTDQYEVPVAIDDLRGAVYVGIRFVK